MQHEGPIVSSRESWSTPLSKSSANTQIHSSLSDSWKAEFSRLGQENEMLHRRIVALENQVMHLTLNAKSSPVCQTSLGKQNSPDSADSADVSSFKVNAMYHLITETIRTWDIRFSGERNVSVKTFIKRIKKQCYLSGLDINKVVQFLSPLFTGTASIWYEHYQDQWQTWKQFSKDARLWFIDDRAYQLELDKQVMERLQGQDEPIRDYMINMIALMGKQDPPMSKRRQLTCLVSNMQPKYKTRIRTCKMNSIEKLLLKIADLEYNIELDKLVDQTESDSSDSLQ